MDNIIFEKIWEGDKSIELKITAISKYLTACQPCYVNEGEINKMVSKIKEYLSDSTKDMYIQFGEKEGNYTPAFSMNILKADAQGCVKIEADIEIDDVYDRSHRCQCFIESELGAIERFAQKAAVIYKAATGTCVSMV